MISKIKNISLIVLSIACVVLFFLLRNEQIANQVNDKVIEQSDTSEWSYGFMFDKPDSVKIKVPVEKTVYKKEVDTLPGDTVRIDSFIYIYKPDSIRSYAFTKTAGDTLTIKDSLRVRGKLLEHKLQYSYNVLVRERTITNTTTTYKEDYKHRLYVGGSYKGDVGATYSHPYFSTGYRYNIPNNRHNFEVAINLFSLFKKKRQ